MGFQQYERVGEGSGKPGVPFTEEAVRGIWAEILATPGARRGSSAFSAQEVNSYEQWLEEEITVARKKDKDRVGMVYLAFLKSLQGKGKPEALDESMREEVTRQLHDQVLSTFDPASGKDGPKKGELKSRLREVAKFLQFLNWLIRLGNAQNLWQWCPPSVPMLLDREPTPFTDTVVNGPVYVQAVRDRLLQDLRTGKTHDGLASEGRILVCALVFGGLAEVAALRELHKAIRSRTVVYHFPQAGWSFLDLEIPMGRGGVRLRRWFPDPLSEILLLRQVAGSPSTDVGTTKEMLTAIDAYLHRLPKRKGKYLRANRLIRVLPELLRIELPQYLAVYATGNLVAHAVRSDRWWHMHGYTHSADAVSPTNMLRKADPIAEAGEIDETEKDSEQPVENSEEIREATWTTPWLLELRKVLRNSDRRIALQQLSKLEEGLSDPLGALFVGWAGHLLRKGSVYHHRLSMRTIRRYVGRLAALMLQILEDPSTLQSAGTPFWQQLYEDLLDTLETEHQRVMILRAIREWHQYLVEKHLAAPISDQQLGGVSIDVVPDARILTHQEFARVKEAIDRGAHVEHHVFLPIILKLLAILGFRCGLRRMEALRLRLTDCHLEGRAMLLIRPFSERSLKSRNSTRAIPLYALLPVEEQQLLKDWVRLRNQAGAGPQDYLFALPEIHHNPIAQETVMSRIHAEMRAVTGDPHIHFHHLRHSFACHVLWRLSLAQVPDAVPPAFLRAEREEARKFHESLLGTVQASRKLLYALTGLLGHSQPEITLNHYVHNLDVLLAVYLRQLLPQKPVDWCGLLSEIPQSTLYRLWDAGGIENVLGRLRKECEGQGILQIPQGKLPTRVESRKNGNKASPVIDSHPEVVIEEIRRLLQQGFLAEKLSPGSKDIWLKLSAESNFSAAELRAMAEKAKWIYGLRGKMGVRHQMVKIPGPGGQIEVPLPPRPRIKLDILVYQQLFPGFWESVTKDPISVSRVLDRYLLQAWTSHPGYFLGTSPKCPEGIAAFRSLLRQWGVGPSQVRYISYDPAERSVWRQQWRDALQLHKQIRIEKRPGPDQGTSKAWLHLYPSFPGAKGKTQLASPGFTYLLIMGAIMVRTLICGD